MSDIAAFSGLQGWLSTLLLSTLLLVYGNRVDINQPQFDMLCIVLSSLFNFNVLCDFPRGTIYVNLQLVKYSFKCPLCPQSCHCLQLKNRDDIVLGKMPILVEEFITLKKNDWHGKKRDQQEK